MVNERDIITRRPDEGHLRATANPICSLVEKIHGRKSEEKRTTGPFSFSFLCVRAQSGMNNQRRTHAHILCCHYSSFITACFCPLPSGLWQQHRHIVTIDIRRKPIETLLTSYSVGKADRRDEEQEEECVCIGSLLFFLSCTHENERGKQGEKRGGDFIPLLLLRRKEKGRGRGGGTLYRPSDVPSLLSLSLSGPDPTFPRLILVVQHTHTPPLPAGLISLPPLNVNSNLLRKTMGDKKHASFSLLSNTT